VKSISLIKVLREILITGGHCALAPRLGALEADTARRIIILARHSEDLVLLLHVTLLVDFLNCDLEHLNFIHEFKNSIFLLLMLLRLICFNDRL